MKLVTETTPTEKGSYAIVGSTIAACSPCCGTTDVYGKDEKPVCRGCGKEFSLTSNAPRREKAASVPQRETRSREGGV